MLKKHNLSIVHCSLLLLILLLCACQNGSNETLKTRVVGRDSLLYAQNFSIERTADSLTILRIGTAWKNAGRKFEYLLYPRHRPRPQTTTLVIPTPVQRVVCTGTTQAAMLDFIGVLDNIAAIADDKYIYNPDIQQRIKNGQIVSIGNDGQWDFERGIAARPDVVFAFSIGDNSQTLDKWAALGVPVVMLSEFMEETPLGRAEWTRFLACFFDETVQARTKQQFDAVAQAYRQLQQQAAQNKSRPKVLTGTAFEGSWYVAGGRSFMAQLIEDAGGDYLWSDNEETGGLPLDFEAVYAKALHADVWLNVLQTKDQTALLQQNARYADFKAFKEGKIYSYTRRVSPNGGYDFFESAIVQPQQVLQDLIYIFNAPQADTGLVYYQLLLPAK